MTRSRTTAGRRVRRRTRVLLTTGTRERPSGHRWSLAFEVKPADLWLGAFYDTMTGPTGRWATLNVWICVVPCFPVHVFLQRPRVGS